MIQTITNLIIYNTKFKTQCNNLRTRIKGTNSVVSVNLSAVTSLTSIYVVVSSQCDYSSIST